MGNIRKCAASTTALDDQIPVLIRKLQERKLWDNTLILFTGDNGYLLGRHGLWSKGLASDPPNMYDEVMKVPMLVSWPGKIPTGEVAPEMVSFYDVLPTLCEAADVAASGRAAGSPGAASSRSPNVIRCQRKVPGTTSCSDISETPRWLATRATSSCCETKARGQMNFMRSPATPGEDQPLR